jgi:hypothetical protein
MRIIWSPEATEDLADLREYIGYDNPSAAHRVAALIIHTIERYLSANPELGAPGRISGTRELVIKTVTKQNAPYGGHRTHLGRAPTERHRPRSGDLLITPSGGPERGLCSSCSALYSQFPLLPLRWHDVHASQTCLSVALPEHLRNLSGCDWRAESAACDLT